MEEKDWEYVMLRLGIVPCGICRLPWDRGEIFNNKKKRCGRNLGFGEEEIRGLALERIEICGDYW